MRKMTMVLAVLLALGMAAPVAAQVVDWNAPVIYGPGLSWDPNYFGPQKPATTPADKAYHETSEPGKHIAPEAPRPVFGAGEAPVLVSCDLMQEMHMGL